MLETIMVIANEVTRHDDSKIFMGIRKGEVGEFEGTPPPSAKFRGF